jgi:hypothetical protein
MYVNSGTAAISERRLSLVGLASHVASETAVSISLATADALESDHL